MEYAERKLENESLSKMGPDLLPLFVMDVVLPCQKFHLNIFEARYRLMVSFLIHAINTSALNIFELSLCLNHRSGESWKEIDEWEW